MQGERTFRYPTATWDADGSGHAVREVEAALAKHGMLYRGYVVFHWPRQMMRRRVPTVLCAIDRALPIQVGYISAPSPRSHVDAVDAMKDAPALQICLVNRISTIPKRKGLEVYRNDLGRMVTIKSAERSTSTRSKLIGARADLVDQRARSMSRTLRGSTMSFQSYRTG